MFFLRMFFLRKTLFWGGPFFPTMLTCIHVAFVVYSHCLCSSNNFLRLCRKYNLGCMVKVVLPSKPVVGNHRATVWCRSASCLISGRNATVWFGVEPTMCVKLSYYLNILSKVKRYFFRAFYEN